MHCGRQACDGCNLLPVQPLIRREAHWLCPRMGRECPVVNTVCRRTEPLQCSIIERVRCVAHFHPKGQFGNPPANRKRRGRVGQIILYGGWENHLLKQRWKNFYSVCPIRSG